jgi:excinuclease UvrABC helicase subunit UvrB
MFNLFGRNHGKSLKQLMDELNEMMSEDQSSLFTRMDINGLSGTDELGEFETESFESPDGSVKYTIRTYKIGGSPKPNKEERGSLESLKKQLETAVKKEDFQLAIHLRDKIKNFEKDQEEIKKIEDELKACIESQDFEQAIGLRDQLRKMRP